MRTLGKVGLFAFVLVAYALAQNSLQTQPSPAAGGPVYDLSIGYTQLAMPIPGAGRVNMNGAELSGSVDLYPRWGLTVDSNYARASNVLGTPHAGYVLTLLGGPVFYPIEHGSTRMFVHLLGGPGLVDGATPTGGTNYRYGWLERFSYSAGGGIEHSVSGPFSIRASGDYLRTSFYDSTGIARPQDNFRLTMSLVFRLRDRRHRTVVP